MDLFEIVYLSLFITAITLQSILYSTASPLHRVRPPSVVAFCRQRRNTAVPQRLSNQLTVSSSPIPKYLHHYVTATFTKVVTVAFGSFFNSLPNRRDDSGLNKAPNPAGTIDSCCPRYGCTVLFGLHAQCSDTGGLPVRVHVEIVRIDGCWHARPPEQAAHVSLSHVTPRTRHAQKVGDTAGRVWVRCHTGSHSVAGHDAARHRRRRAAATDPGRVLDLKCLG